MQMLGDSLSGDTSGEMIVYESEGEEREEGCSTTASRYTRQCTIRASGEIYAMTNRRVHETERGMSRTLERESTATHSHRQELRAWNVLHLYSI